MAHTLKRKKPRTLQQQLRRMETMATAEAVKETRTGPYCEDCNTTVDVDQYCSECGEALCSSCYSDEGHEDHDG